MRKSIDFTAFKLDFPSEICYNCFMQKINFTGLSPEQIEYVSTLEKVVENQQIRINQLTELLIKSQKALYGQSSEKRRYVFGEDNGQISLFNEAEVTANNKAEEPAVQTIVAAYVRKPKRTKEELAQTVPVVEVVCDLDEDKRSCGICQADLRYLGKEHVRDELEIIPAQVRVLRYVRFNYVCTVCEKETGDASIVKAPVPAPVMKRSLASPSTVAYVMYQKYANGMPLYRQEKDWANQGVTLSRATLANWIIRPSHEWLEPVYNAIKECLVTEPLIHADETVLQVLKEPGRKATTESRMWVYTSGRSPTPAILFEYQPTRSGQHARRFLEGFSGYLQTDGFSGCNAVPNVIHCGCWAHLQRKFEEAIPDGADAKTSKAAIGYDYCNRLFAMDKKWEGLSDERRHEERLVNMKPLLDEFWQWVSALNPLPKSNLGKAVTYAMNQKDSLNNILLDGRIELSNNRAENAIRPYVTGRKNWLFADTTRGAKASAIVYSIIETAKANQLNPYMYLVYLLSKLPGLKELTKESLTPYLPWCPELPPWCHSDSCKAPQD